MRETGSAGDRTYRRLKADLMNGHLSTHLRLELTELAQRYEVSTTPVREAAMRLHGEGLLELHPKGGLRPAYMREIDIAALFELHGRLATLALRWPGRGPVGALAADEGSDNRTRRFFTALAQATGNAELVRTMARLGDRLERYRRLDARLLTDVDAEIADLVAAGSTPGRLGSLLRRYHKRRQALAPRYILLEAATEATSR